jgi:integrase
MLNHAVDDGVLPNNPAIRMGRMVPQRQHTGQEIIPLTRDELTLLLRTVQEAAPAYSPLFLYLARTGMRLGEALALQWGDIDFRGRFIEVRRNYVRRRITRPKNGKTWRVDMSQQLAETLHHLLTQRKAETLRHG